MTASLRFKKLDPQKKLQEKSGTSCHRRIFMFYYGVRTYSPPQTSDHKNGCNSQIGVG